MKSIQKNFEHLQKRNPGWSSNTCFAMTVAHKKYGHKNIIYWFNKLVEKDDYARKEKNITIASHDKLSNMSEEGMIRG